jgi:hypothetical protein
MHYNYYLAVNAIWNSKEAKYQSNCEVIFTFRNHNKTRIVGYPQVLKMSSSLFSVHHTTNIHLLPIKIY